MHRVTTRYQTAHPTSTAARERVSSSDASALIVLLSICFLTMVEFDMLSAADRQQIASLHTTQQQQRVSAHFVLHAMHTTHVYVAAWHSP